MPWQSWSVLTPQEKQWLGRRRLLVAGETHDAEVQARRAIAEARGAAAQPKPGVAIRERRSIGEIARELTRSVQQPVRSQVAGFEVTIPRGLAKIVGDVGAPSGSSLQSLAAEAVFAGGPSFIGTGASAAASENAAKELLRRAGTRIARRPILTTAEREAARGEALSGLRGRGARIRTAPSPAEPAVQSEISKIANRAIAEVRGQVRDVPTKIKPSGTQPFKPEKLGEPAASVIRASRGLFKGLETEQRRGVLSDAAVDDLARLVGIRKDDLLRLQPGRALSAEHIASARQILKESAEEVYGAAQRFLSDKGHEAKGRFVDLLNQHGQLQARVAGLASEAGRSLRQFRRVLQESPSIGQGIDEAIAALPGDLRQIAEKVAAGGRTGAVHALGELRAPTWKDMLAEFGAAAKISGPLTQLRNIVGNAAAAAIRPVERAATGIAEAARSLITGQPRERFVGEAVADVFGKAAALKDASRNFIRALASEEFGSRAREAGRIGVIPGRTGRIVRLPFRFLTGVDEFWREINRRGTIYAKAYREVAKDGQPLSEMGSAIARFVSNPSVEVAERIEREVSEYLFQSELSDSMRLLLANRNKYLVARILFPFFRTPVNLVKFVFERSPLGVLSPRNIAGFRAGGAAASEAAARIMVGSMISAAVALRAAEGLITAGGPEDRKQRELLQAQGWQPYSVKVGDRWVSYRGFDPIASFLSNVVSYLEVRSEPEQLVAAVKLAKQVGRNISNATWLTGMRTVLDALDDPERYGENLISSTIGGFVPRMLDPITKALDPMLREAKGAVQQVQRQLPRLSRRLPARRDVLGREIRPEGGPLRGLFPSVSTEREEPALRELSRLGLGIPEPARTIRRHGETRVVPQALRRRLQVERGIQIKQRIDELLKDSEYQTLRDDEKRIVVQRAIMDAARTTQPRDEELARKR